MYLRIAFFRPPFYNTLRIEWVNCVEKIVKISRKEQEKTKKQILSDMKGIISDDNIPMEIREQCLNIYVDISKQHVHSFDAYDIFLIMAMVFGFFIGTNYIPRFYTQK